MIILGSGLDMNQHKLTPLQNLQQVKYSNSQYCYTNLLKMFFFSSTTRNLQYYFNVMNPVGENES